METQISQQSQETQIKIQSIKAVSDAWKELYLQAKAEIEILRAENEKLRAERDNANRNIERLSAIQWNRPVGF